VKAATSIFNRTSTDLCVDISEGRGGDELACAEEISSSNLCEDKAVCHCPFPTLSACSCEEASAEGSDPFMESVSCLAHLH
jgi:hypothetical protein